MAYNKIRREISELLALEDATTIAQQADRQRLIEAIASTDDDSALANNKVWQAFATQAINDRDHLISAMRLLRKILLVVLGGPVVETKPLKFSEVRDQITMLADLPDAQVAHPCETPAVGVCCGQGDCSTCETSSNEQADGFRGPQPEETSALQSRG